MVKRFVLLFVVLFVVACSASSETVGQSGDELVVATGVDYSWARPSPSGLYSGGYTFACRYVSHDTTGKNISSSEASSLWAAGVDIVSNFEDSATNALGGFSQGVSDAVYADSLAKSAGMPSTRPIYFSVDFDAQPGDMSSINAYFDGVASVIGVGRTGAYGGFYPIQQLFNGGKIRWGWQTYAWSYGNWDTRAQLRQVQNGITAAGDSNCCDEDQAQVADYGEWHAKGGDPCASASDGYYCGQSTQWAGGTTDHLYDCVGGKTSSNVACPGGCIVEPSGKPDQCAPYDGGAPDSGATDAGSHPDAAPPPDSGATEPPPPPPHRSGCAVGAAQPRSGDSAMWMLVAACALARRRKT